MLRAAYSAPSTFIAELKRSAMKMNHEKQSILLPPKWLKEWLPILASFGIPGSAIVAYLKVVWRNTDSTALVGTRTLIIASLGIVFCLVGLFWVSFKRKIKMNELENTIKQVNEIIELKNKEIEELKNKQKSEFKLPDYIPISERNKSSGGGDVIFRR
jgi:hypothetical protein